MVVGIGMHLAEAIAQLGPIDGDEKTRRRRNEAATVVFAKLNEIAPKVFSGGWARALGDNGWDDAVQTVLVKLMLRGPVEPPPNAEAFLWTAVRNALADQVRKQKGETRKQDGLRRETEDRPATCLVSPPEIEILPTDRERFDEIVSARQAKSSVSTVASTVDLCRRINAGQISFREACAEVGVDESALYKRISNTRKRLRADILEVRPERDRAALVLILNEIGLRG